ncbi:MAG TPA: RNA 2',3'-cyclic phosphodiesterase [Thermoanaerobaculia bacterium]|nr:RNA 2',3'-cyclic phosphodiesterase [Thermoanaerobaculia bacterium]
MRLFIAMSFPAAVMTDLNARVVALKPKLPPASWVRPEAQHLTFAFLGERDEPLVARLEPQLEETLGRAPRFEAVLHGAGLFPNPRRARVGWVGLEPAAPFIDTASRIRGVLTRNDVELDGADFKPHLTLMRIRDRWPPASIEMFERALREYRSAPFVTVTITLYSSRLDPAGAIHTPLRHFALA